ncbi:hypothetical protein EDD36DRAFT_418574 [Exophiala viscosa]|uniref:Uncharacterized protein n=1 Tax=Exophiala viscosa TaxID=2486360 RepID=A0AAN6DUK8_9EURO|nr:hypothetical protein EDD36DRAFT_418574 [Exophiala viscosa]
MPAHDNVLHLTTPAPTRRFLPASSLRSSSSAAGTVRKTPFQTSRTTQAPFSTPSSTTVARFQRGITQKDEIDSSYDDDDETESPDLSRRRVKATIDDIVGAETEDVALASPLLQRTKRFQPPTKKRKVSQVEPKHGEPITISSSPEYDNPDDYEAHDGTQHAGSDIEDTNLDDLLQVTDTEMSSKPARFKPPNADLIESIPLSRTVFRTNLEEGQSVSTATAPVLPDVFSPSRRKGKRDFLPGGSAELVREWVLDIAAQDSITHNLPEDIITITSTRIDDSGRFAVVRDDTGSQWLLPEQQQKAGLGGKMDWRHLRRDSQILLKGQATKWALESHEPALDNVIVAGYWELLFPS